jgi:hypothetical protein
MKIFLDIPVSFDAAYFRVCLFFDVKAIQKERAKRKRPKGKGQKEKAKRKRPKKKGDSLGAALS